MSSITRFSTMVRRRGTTVAGLSEHWRTTHAEAVRGLEGLTGYIQNHPVVEHGRPLLGWTPFDACAEIEFPDTETMNAAFSSEHARTVVGPDAPLFLEIDRGGLTLTERRVLLGSREEEGVKLITLFRRHPSCSPELLVDVLRGAYAEAVQEVEPLRHEQLIPVARGGPPGTLPGCDAVDLLWFTDAESAVTFLGSAAAGRAADALAGRTLGCERMLATPLRVIP